MPKSTKEIQDELKQKGGEPTPTEKTEVPKEPAAKVVKQETAIETVQPAQIDPKTNQLVLTPKHIELIKTQIAPTATQEEFELFIMMAYRTRLDPLMKQLYFIKYEGRNGNPDKVSYVTSIDSYRIIAARTHEMAGTDEPRFEYDKSGRLTHCSITVYRMVQGQRCPFSAKVKFLEYTTNKNLWTSKPETMLAKVAEAHALRKAFPNDLSGIYTQEEMDRAEQPEKPKIERITDAQMQTIRNLLGQKGILENEFISKVEDAAKVARGNIGKLENFSKKLADTMIKKLSSLPDYEAPEPDLQEDVVEVDVDEIDNGIEEMRAGKNDAVPGAKYPETIQ